MATIIQQISDNGGFDRKTKTLNTRIALKVDSIQNWEKSTTLLYPGEIAISYQIADDGSKYDFRIRIGNRTTWNNSPKLRSNSNIDRDEVEQIIEEYLIENEYCTKEMVESLITNAFDAEGDKFDQAFARKFTGGGYDAELNAITTDSIVIGSNAWVINGGNAKLQWDDNEHE